MSKVILENVKKYFEGALEVNFFETLTTDSTSSCNTETIPKFTDEAVDLYILIKPENDNTKSYFAAATSCDRSTVDNRPYTGIYFLNFAGMQTGKLNEYLYFSTYAHELTHILGFSNSLFSLYKKEDGITDRPENEVWGGSFEKLIFIFYRFPNWGVSLQRDNSSRSGRIRKEIF